jgi:hypothetical protein
MGRFANLCTGGPISRPHPHREPVLIDVPLELRLPAGICPTTLHEHDPAVVELNRMHPRDGWPARRLCEKVTKVLLRLVRFGDLVSQQIGQGPYYKLRQRTPVVTPAPDGHFADTEEAGSGCIAAKHDPECKIMPSGGQTALEARGRYWAETRSHDSPPVCLDVLRSEKFSICKQLYRIEI